MSIIKINGIPITYVDVLAEQGIDWQSDDDTVFGPVVYCNQHMREHKTGWCTVHNFEKWVPGNDPRQVTEIVTYKLPSPRDKS